MFIYPKARQVALIATLTACFGMAPAVAQYVGPSAVAQPTVAQILKNPIDDQDVQLRGYLLRQTANDKYLFSDGTAEIIAEIDKKQFPAQPVNEKTQVEIIGEVDTGINRAPEIEVDSIRIVE